MIIRKEVVGKLFEFVGLVRTENYYKFCNVDGYLTVFGMDNYSYFKISTHEKWDLEIDEFNINLPNLNFISDDVSVVLDNNYVYFRFDNNNINETEIKLLLLSDDMYPEFNFTVNNTVDITDNYTAVKDLFKEMLKHTNNGADDFTSCIYADNNNMFATDKMSSCWYASENSLFNTNKLLIDAKFIALFSRFDKFDKFYMIYSENKVGFIVDYLKDTNIQIQYLTTTLFLNYPDFKTIFDRFDYTDSVLFHAKDVTEVLSNIIKFDSKADRVVLTISPEAGVTINEKSIDNSKFIDLNVPFLDETLTYDGPFSIILNPHLLLKSIQGVEMFTLYFNYSKKQPILLTFDDINLRKYIQVYHA